MIFFSFFLFGGLKKIHQFLKHYLGPLAKLYRHKGLITGFMKCSFPFL